MPSAEPSQPANAQPRARKASDWPNDAGPKLQAFALDRYMIAHYDSRPVAEVEAFQFQHLSRLLSHAARHSPWWQERLGPIRKGGTLDFHRIPLMTREHYRAFLTASGGPLPLPGGHGQAQPNATSGSSGIPLSFYTSSLCGRMNGAHSSYDRSRQGLDPGRLLARIIRKVGEHSGPHLRVPSNALYRRNEEVQRRSNSFTSEEHARWLSEVRPAYVFANVRLLSGILDAYEEGAADPPGQPIDAVLSFAETVTPEFRVRARRILGARVLDRYSCEEAGPLAFQCPSSDAHYHVASTNAVVEVLDERGVRCRPGEIGRVFVTSLHNYASPVVRYELGDLAAWAPRCVCGYDKPVLTDLLGRVRFLIRLPSGGRKHVVVTARDWLSVAPFRETRLVQVSQAVIRAEYVLDRALSREEEAKLTGILETEISPELRYDLTRVERIDWGPTYKRQDVVSLI